MTKFAFVFPGQGSQSRGMMNGYADFAAVRDTFTEASDVLKQDLWQLVAEGSDADLNATVNTQPVMLTAGVAVYRAWQSQNTLRWLRLVRLLLPMRYRWCAIVHNVCNKPCRKAWVA